MHPSHHSSLAGASGGGSSGSLPIYSGYRSPAKAPPSSLSTNAAASSHHAHAPFAQASPSRATQAAFLRQRSPRGHTGGASHGFGAPSAFHGQANAVPSFDELVPMTVPSMLDDEPEATQTEDWYAPQQPWRATPSFAAVTHAPNTGGASFSAVQHRSSAAVAAPRPTLSSSRSSSHSTVPAAATTTTLPSPTPSPSSIDPAMLPVVHAFLRQVSASLDPGSAGSGSTLECELTPQTVSALYELAEHLRGNDERAAIIEEEMNEAAREYAAEAARIQANLSGLGLSVSSLTPSAQQHVSTLTSLAQLLGLKNVEPATFTAGLIDLRDSYHAGRDALSCTRELVSDYRRQTASEQRLLDELRSLDAGLEAAQREREPDLQDKRRQVPFFQAKIRDYERETQELEHRLQASGFVPHLSHESLVTLSDEISMLHARIDPLDQQLSTYQLLPPDMTLARIRVEEARQQLAQLEDQFTQDIRQMQQEEM